MGQLAIYHAKRFMQAYARKETFKFYCQQIPEYLKPLQEWVSLLQCISLTIMMGTCPKLYCIKRWATNDADFAVHGVLNDFCDETDKIRIEYSILSVMVTLIFFVRMSDLVGMNNAVSTYLIMALEC